MLYSRYSFVFALALFASSEVIAEPGHAKVGFLGFGKAQNNKPAEHKDVQVLRQEEKKANKEVSIDSAMEDVNADKKNLGRTDGKFGANQKRSRLTAGERRALRRQIQDAGQEIYIPAK